jgi:type III restriction enzyme
MKISQIAFQQRAIRDLRLCVAQAMDGFAKYHKPQVISYSAPTGAGKTIIMGSLIEDIFFGDASFPEQPDAIFVWLSDSPELNQQSKDKIDTKSDRLTYGQTETINEASFNQRVLSDGKVYFLNTQKLSTSSLLTKHGDSRQWTIWETLANTVEEKGNRLYFIIDEAHRGTQGTKQATATTIMQKFLKGSAADGLPAMPVVIGVTATPERFDRLAAGLTSTVHKVVTTADEVRSSGLLKDVIEIGYPSALGNEMAVLQTATDEWIDKCRHWEQYCREQHYAYINPVMVVQVQNGSGSKISATDLDECLHKIEERCGRRFEEGEVVHTFGQTTGDVLMNGLAVHYEEPSRIADDMKIKVVFFKENLSTGWDCPRAETMVSFRHASDATYIAQLLGRMIRTPRGQRIQVDESLNNVWLFLPFFDERTLHEVVEQIQSTDGAGLPTSVDSQQIDNKTVETLTVRTPQRGTSNVSSGTTVPNKPIQVGSESCETYAFFGQQISGGTQQSGEIPQTGTDDSVHKENGMPKQEIPQVEPITDTQIEEVSDKEDSAEADCRTEDLDREGIINAINKMGLQTYEVRTVRINNYLSSLFSMAHFLVRSRINTNAVNKATQDVVQMIAKYVADLKVSGKYEELAKKVMQYKLNVESLDVYGKALQVHQSTLFSTTDLDLDRQVRQADAKLAREGLSNRYGEVYYSDDDPNSCKVDIILFTSDSDQMAALENYAKMEFHRICDETRIKAIGLSPENRKKYDDIVANGDEVTPHNFMLPIDILSIRDEGGTDWPDHLYVHPKTREAIIKLNTWEADVIEEERQRPDYVCWVRNLSRSSWGLVVPYEMDGETKRAYPDFLIVRSNDAEGYIVDILEPHDPSRKDNLPKAKGFAKYAKGNPQIGRLQLIRQTSDASGVRYRRLDLTKSLVQEAVSKATTDEELTHIFASYGVYEN